MKAKLILPLLVTLGIIMSLGGGIYPTASAQQLADAQSFVAPPPVISTAVAFDVSLPLRDLTDHSQTFPSPGTGDVLEISPHDVLPALPLGYTGDGALQLSPSTTAIDPPLVNFEGQSNTDNFNVLGFRVNPPDPSGDVGPDHYVEMINLTFAVYNKAGSRLLGPLAIADLWNGFAIADCIANQGSPIVLYDQLADRWLLSQIDATGPNYYLCMAVSTTGDPTGAYYRYAFSSGAIFSDYPKYGVWSDSYIITTRDFLGSDYTGVSIYALQKSDMLVGDPTPLFLRFNLDVSIVPLFLIGDGLLPADIDGDTLPKTFSTAPIFGLMDDGGPYAAPFDGLNIFGLYVNWGGPTGSLTLETQLPVASFDSIFPCGTSSFRDCIPQPGVPESQYLDILSYRQRLTHRLAFRNFGNYESLVASHSVEARAGIAGMRWYEVRRASNGTYSLYQQGTYSPDDGVHRWMGSIAQDQVGNFSLGYSVSNGVSVFPGIRYAGRLASAPIGQMNLGEGVIINGSGVQTTTNSRWGDYTSMNIDPVDDCTFWYINEYYTLDGQNSSPVGWQTRVASFKLPNCSFHTWLPLAMR